MGLVFCVLFFLEVITFHCRFCEPIEWCRRVCMLVTFLASWLSKGHLLWDVPIHVPGKVFLPEEKQSCSDNAVIDAGLKLPRR